MLFYLKYSPREFQSSHSLTSRDQYGFSTVSEFGKFVFQSVSPLDQVKGQYPGALIVGSDGEVPEGSNVVKRVYFPSGRIVFEAVKN